MLAPHGPVFPSFAFRFDTDEGSVVFPETPVKSANVVRLAEGADVLVHEAIDLDFYREAGAPPAVLSHLAPGATGTVPDGRWISRAKMHFSGRVVRAHELQSLPLR